MKKVELDAIKTLYVDGNAAWINDGIKHYITFGERQQINMVKRLASDLAVIEYLDGKRLYLDISDDKITVMHQLSRRYKY